MHIPMTREDILAALQRANRPDLSVPDAVREAIPHNAFIAHYLASIAAYAEKCRGTAIPAIPFAAFRLFADTGDRWVYEDGERGYFPRRGRLACFAALAWLYGREEDIAELEDIIWAVCDEYTWALPAHLPRTEENNSFADRLENGRYTVDLFAAETGDAMAEIAFLMGDRLHGIIRRRIARLLEERIFSRVLEDDFFWMHCDTNWASVCAGSVGMAAIYAVDDEKRLADILARILPSMYNFLSGFASDGSCLEGISYWNYGFGYFTAFADLLCRRTAGAIDLFDDPAVRNIAMFQQKCYFPGGRTVSFSDGDSRASYQAGLTSYLHRRYPEVTVPPAAYSQQAASEDHCFRWSSLLRNLLWAGDAPAEGTSAPVHHILPAAQWYIATGERGVGIAAKGGCNAEPHNHNDVGSFQIFRNGEEILADLGPGEYTRQYFSDLRYTFFPCSSRGHSLPIIDGCTQRTGADARAQDVALSPEGISLDMAAAYGIPSLTALRRTVSFDGDKGTAELEDLFTFAEGIHDIIERFIAHGAEIAEPGQIILRTGMESMLLSYDPEIFSVCISPVTYAMHNGVTRTVFTVDLNARASETFRAAFSVSPAD